MRLFQLQQVIMRAKHLHLEQNGEFVQLVQQIYTCVHNIFTLIQMT